jgi:hypothetical protein
MDRCGLAAVMALVLVFVRLAVLILNPTALAQPLAGSVDPDAAVTHSSSADSTPASEGM